MLRIIQTETFSTWLNSLNDRQAVTRILARIRQASFGHLGDVEPVGEGVSEMRIFYGPGYRLFFVQEGSTLILLLNGGTKKSQGRDITKAKALAKTWRNR